MKSRTWLFKSVTHVHAAGVACVWKWQAESPEGNSMQSAGAFNTLSECLGDARRHGFEGSVDPRHGSVTASGYTVYPVPRARG